MLCRLEPAPLLLLCGPESMPWYCKPARQECCMMHATALGHNSLQHGCHRWTALHDQLPARLGVPLHLANASDSALNEQRKEDVREHLHAWQQRDTATQPHSIRSAAVQAGGSTHLMYSLLQSGGCRILKFGMLANVWRSGEPCHCCCLREVLLHYPGTVLLPPSLAASPAQCW
jgi:hypothetical protein